MRKGLVLEGGAMGGLLSGGCGLCSNKALLIGQCVAWPRSDVTSQQRGVKGM